MHRWVTMTEAVRLLRLSDDTIRRRIKGGQVSARRDNNGRYLVLVPDDDAPQAPHAIIDEPARAAQLPQGVAPQAPQVAPDAPQGAERLIEELRRQLEKSDQRHREEFDRLANQTTTERALWLERIDAAEIRAERVESKLEQILDEMLAERRPWWASLFGASNRSRLG